MSFETETNYESMVIYTREVFDFFSLFKPGKKISSKKIKLEGILFGFAHLTVKETWALRQMMTPVFCSWSVCTHCGRRIITQFGLEVTFRVPVIPTPLPWVDDTILRIVPKKKNLLKLAYSVLTIRMKIHHSIMCYFLIYICNWSFSVQTFMHVMMCTVRNFSWKLYLDRKNSAYCVKNTRTASSSVNWIS